MELSAPAAGLIGAIIAAAATVVVAWLGARVQRIEQQRVDDHDRAERDRAELESRISSAVQLGARDHEMIERLLAERQILAEQYRDERAALLAEIDALRAELGRVDTAHAERVDALEAEIDECEKARRAQNRVIEALQLEVARLAGKEPGLPFMD